MFQSVFHIADQCLGTKDPKREGNVEVYGFIAQEVKEVIPASTNTKFNFIPDILQLADVSRADDGSKILTFNDENEGVEIIQQNSHLRCYDQKDNGILVTVEEVISSNSFKLSLEDLSGVNVADPSGGCDKVFVYGNYVSDFHTLKKDAIWTVATAALQEVDRQLQAEKAKTATLEAKVATLEENMAKVLTNLGI